MAITAMATPGKCFELPVTVRFGDTDPFGVVYFASYFRYCHDGMVEFLQHIGVSPRDIFKDREEGFGLPVAGASCEFLKPVCYGDTLRLLVFIMHAKSKAVTFGFHFYHAEKNELVAHGEATIVAIDKGWRSQNLPDRLRTALEPYLPPVQGS